MTPVELATSAAEDELGMSSRELDLVRAAYRVVGRQGSNRVSLQDIAKEATVSKGLLLYHFKSKDNLLLAMMRWALVGTAARIRAGVAEAATPASHLRAVVDAVWVSPEANRRFYLLYIDLIEHAARLEAFAGLPGVTREIVEGVYVDVIAAGMDSGELDVDDLEGAAVDMRALIDGMFLLWLQREDWETAHDEFRERCYQGLLHLFGAA